MRAVHLAAFDGPAEADLVDRLRGRCFPQVSLVATDKARIVGHILFTPVLLPGLDGTRLETWRDKLADQMRQIPGMAGLIRRIVRQAGENPVWPELLVRLQDQGEPA